MMSKSANYCYANLSGGMGLLLLCEVAAQPFYERANAEYNADQGCRAAGALATKGLGTRVLMIGTLTGFQWWIYDTFKTAMGMGTTGGK